MELKSRPLKAEMKIVKAGSNLKSIVLMVLVSACTAAEETSVMEPPPPIEPVYDCTFYQKFNTEASCNESTRAQCTSAYQTFPNGGQLCWAHVEGGEICTDPGYPAPFWQYSLGTAWCRKPTGNPYPYYRLRSSIGCSSLICLCEGAPVLYDQNQTCDAATCPGTANPPVETIPCCPGETCP